MVDINRKTFRDIDWLLLLTPVALTALGCVGIHSTAPHAEMTKQLIALGIGLVATVVLMLNDYRKIIINIAPFFYGAIMVLLVLVLIPGIGKEINGNQAWLRIAGFSLQPSEFAKAATILMLARHMALPRTGSLSVKDMVIMTAITLPPIILIALEHDTGTMLTFGTILGAFFFLSGLRKMLVAAALVAVVVGLIAIYPHLRGYQKERIDVIIHPEKADPKGYAYQTIQSVIAVGSGGPLGKGVGQSTQGKLGFLPFAWTDFIAAVIAEELGFAGIMLMMVLYLIFIWRMVAIAQGSRDRAGALMIMGFVALIGFHILCNLGMVVGLMPIMGIP